MFAAGNLNKRIAIQSRSATTDSFNQTIDTWATITNGETWASVSPVRSSESIQAAANRAELSHRVTIRFRPDINQSMRILFESRILAITGIRNPDEKGEYMEITCMEGSAHE